MAFERRDIDRGWAWWVLLASYVNLLLCSGLSFVAGMFQVVFLQEFGGSVALTSWVTALFSSFMQLGGPLSSALANTVSCRAAVMVGGACLGLGLAFSAMVDSLGLLFVFFGIVAGAGLGLTYTASVVVINYYFDRRRTMVTGIALSSGGLGIVLAPQVSTFLFQNFSWREALAVMAAVSAQVCILGALMFPMHEKKDTLCSRFYTSCVSRRGKQESRKGAVAGCNDERDDDDGSLKVRLVKEENNGSVVASNGGTTFINNKSLQNGYGNYNEKGKHDVVNGEAASLGPNQFCGVHSFDTSVTVIDDVNSNQNGNTCYDLELPVITKDTSNFLSTKTNGGTSTLTHEKGAPVVHQNRKQVNRIVDMNDSTSSLREFAHQSPPRYSHIRYVLSSQGNKPRGSTSPTRYKRSGKHINQTSFYLDKACPKSQSHYELTYFNPKRHKSHSVIGETFQSNKELHSSKTSENQQSHIPYLMSPQSSNVNNASADKVNNVSSTDIQMPDRSSVIDESCERLGNLTTNGSIRKRSSRCSGINSVAGASWSHLHATVIPHSPSLLSLVASSHHLDVILHTNDHQLNGSTKDHIVPHDHPLYNDLFGSHGGKNRTSKSFLGLSQPSLKSSKSVLLQNGAHVTLQELPAHQKTATSLALSSISVRQENGHANGKAELHTTPNNDDKDVETATRIKSSERPLSRNPAFFLLCVQLFVANCACGVFNIHLPSFAMSKGLTDQQMTNILSLNGLALLNGRMLVGALASATGLDLLIYWALHVIGGLFVILLPAIADSYLTFCCVILGVGTFFGSVYSVLTSLTLKYVGLSDLATAFGVEMVSAGLGYLLAPPVAGILVDHTGDYDYNMYCGGGLLIVSALILMLLPVIEPEVTRNDLVASWGSGGDNEVIGHRGVEVDIEIVADCDDDVGSCPSESGDEVDEDMG